VAGVARLTSQLLHRRCRDLEDSGHIIRGITTNEQEHDTLRELGEGFAFVGRQVHFEVDGDDFFVDLLFFHVEQLRYVVIELKTGKFRPEYLGQLGFYVALVDDKLRRPQHADTVGLLLVADKNDAVVRYSLAGQQTPIGVASYDLLPPAVRAALPSEADLAAALATETNTLES
jgi:hypothetical protein